MHDVRSELKDVLKTQKVKNDVVSLEEQINLEFNELFTKLDGKLSTSHNTLINILAKKNEINPYSLESRSLEISLENMFTDFFKNIGDFIYKVFKFIYEMVLRVINALIDMFITRTKKKPPEGKYVIDNNTKLMAYIYDENIALNTTFTDISRNLINIRNSLELAVVEQKSLMDLFYKWVDHYANFTSITSDKKLRDIDTVLNQLVSYTDKDSIKPTTGERLELLRDLRDFINDSGNKELPLSGMSQIKFNDLSGFKKMKDKYVFKINEYERNKTGLYVVSNSTKTYTEEEVEQIVKDITEEKVVSILDIIEAFIKDSKDNKINFMKSTYGFDKEVENTARNFTKFFNTKYKDDDAAKRQQVNNIKTYVDYLVKSMKFKATYLKDTLMMTMGTYNDLPVIYSVKETEGE